MKNLKVKLLSVAAIALVATGGLYLQNAQTVSAETSPFKMVEGASIRVPTQDEATGIRFRSLLTKTQKAAYDEAGYTISAGTFILPSSYYAANPLTAANVTTDYCWDSAEQGKKQILNVVGTLYEDAETPDYYTLNGSVLNILDPNFMLDYMGVGYLKLEKGGETTYVLAETNVDNARTPVEVAEKAIAANDANSETLVTNYVDKYVAVYKEANGGEAPVVEYKENVYLQTKTGYELSTELSGVKEAAFSGYGATATAEAQKGEYNYSKNNAENHFAPLSITKQTETDVYYDYVGNKFEIFDFEGSTTAELLNGGTHNNADACSFTQAHAADGLQSMVVYTSNSWVGTQRVSEANARKFPAPSDKISMMVKTSTSFTFTISFSFVYEDGSTDSWVTKSQSVTASDDWQKVTFTLDKKATHLRAATFQTFTTHSYWVDSVYAECDFAVEEVEVPTSYEGSTAEISFNAPTKVYGEGLYAEDAANVEYKAEYKPTTASDYSEASFADGKFSFTATDSQSYDVKVTATLNGKTHVQEFVVEPLDPNLMLITDFESGVTAASAYGTSNSIGAGNYIESGNVFKGDGQKDWVGFTLAAPVDLGGSYNTFKFTMYSSIDCKLNFYVTGSNTVDFEVTAGVHEYTITLPTAITQMKGTIYIDFAKYGHDGANTFEFDNLYVVKDVA